MKAFDRILNIVLAVAVALFAADYFLKDGSAGLDAAAESARTAKAGEFQALSWEQLDAAVNDASGKTTLVAVFTSWCPYCKKMIPVISEMAQEEKDRMNVLAISIDENPEAIKAYVAGHMPPLSFPVYLHRTDKERELLQGFLYAHKLNFTGGIPYLAFFHKGVPVQQIGGFVEKEILTKTLDRIEHPEKDTDTGF